MMKQKEYSSCKYRVSRIRIPFIFREVNIVTSFDDINEKRSFICEPLNTPHFTSKRREEISMHQQAEFHGSFSSGEIKSHSLWNSYKDSIFLVDHIYVLAAQKNNSLLSKLNEIILRKRKKRQTSSENFGSCLSESFSSTKTMSSFIIL